MSGSGAAREFELKLEIPSPTVSKVMRLPWLWELASGELQASSLQSVYYDTPSYALRERGVTLRVRRSGATCRQTIKAAVNGAALPIERGEWEDEIAGDEPELKLVSGTPLGRMSRKKLRRRLRPCFEIHVDRSAFPIQSANSAIEVAIDRAHIVGEHTLSFCEIELELKRGASSEMARIARRIASEVPAALALTTKADRGFALRLGRPPAPSYADAISLAASNRVGESFQSIAWSCLRHFALNREAVEAGAAEAAHQMRLGLQRLRAAIGLFKRLLDGPETDAVGAELDWLEAELAPACDLDLLLEKTLTPLLKQQTDATALEALCGEVSARRQAALEQAGVAVGSDRYRQLTLRTALWIIAAEWSDQANRTYEQPSRRVGAFAPRALSKQAADTLRQVNRFERLGSEQRKALYRSLQQLRFSIGFFAELYPRKPQRAFLKPVQTLQRNLGRLIDFTVHERLRDEFMQSWTSEQGAADPRTAQKAFALGFALGQQTPEKVARVLAIKRAQRRLSRAGRFWK